MKREVFSGFLVISLLISMLGTAQQLRRGIVNGGVPSIDRSIEPNSIGDAIIAPDIASFLSGSPIALPPSPGYLETSEYLIGSVAVGIILLESNGTIDPSNETWSSEREAQVVNETFGGLTWLANQNPQANISFIYDIHYAIPTSYEPINRPTTDQNLWITQAMNSLGYTSTDYFTQVRDYIHALRLNYHTDWAFSIFIVDSLNDTDGCFTNWIDANHTRKWSAYAYLGGPFLVMTYDNEGYGIGNMDYVSAHESCHIFYATDEYDGYSQTSGYLGVQDFEGSGCMMQYGNTWWLCSNSKKQLGWRDTDADGIQDIVDTYPNSTLTPYSPNPTNKPILDFTGSIKEIPYPNKNPYGTRQNITINMISRVEFRVDNGSWQTAGANDTAFDEADENFYFTTPPLSTGYHNIEVRGVNSVGNIETDYASDTVLRSSSMVYVPEDFPTIQKAINAAYAGDIISVAPGTYYENIVLNKSISLIGAGIDTTIIDGNFTGNVMNITASNANVSGFTIQRSGTSWPNGIYVTSHGNNVSGNIITNNYCGIYLDHSSNNSISGNNITNSVRGIFVNSCSNNTIFGNNITANTEAGISLDSSSNNSIFHNNFVNNNIQVFFFTSDCADVWDDGYPSGGNCWSNYAGIDEKSGPNQDQNGSDGIGDTSFVIDSYNIDHYPLMVPLAHDIATVNVALSKTIVGQGYGGNVTVTAQNGGTLTEYFAVTTYANTTVTSVLNFNLTSGSIQNKTYVWNTTGFAYGNYILKGVGDVVLGEVDVADNNYTCPVSVHVGVPGDISGPTQGVYDGTANMRDINYLILLFNTNPSSPNWKPNADINNDGTVNMRDIQIVVLNFNKYE